MVYEGKVTEIAETIQAGSVEDEFNQNQVLQLVNQKDNGGRTPIDIAW